MGYTYIEEYFYWYGENDFYTPTMLLQIFSFKNFQKWGGTF